MLSSLLSGIATKLITALLTEAVIIKVLVRLGDYLVVRTSNNLDNEIWGEVKKALGEADEGNS